MMETAKKISIAGSNQCENTMNNQTENARKIQHEKHMKLFKNETIKFLPFSLSFETAQKILGFTNKYETVKIIITSFDFHMNTPLNETPKDVSNFVIFETAQKLACLK